MTLQTLSSRSAAKLILSYLRVTGGAGSGNYGHAGRPGEVGGSSSAKEAFELSKTAAKTGKKSDYERAIKAHLAIRDRAGWDPSFEVHNNEVLRLKKEAGITSSLVEPKQSGNLIDKWISAGGGDPSQVPGDKEFQRMRDPHSKEGREFTKILGKKTYEGDAFRGVVLTKSELNQYQVGKIITTKLHDSASTDKSQALEFTNPFGKKSESVLFHIVGSFGDLRGKRGSGESEVVSKAGSKYRVAKVVKGKDYTTIHLTQLKVRHLGGEGSGNFGHKGRPGEVGGSSSEGGDNPKRKELLDQVLEKSGVSKKRKEIDRVADQMGFPKEKIHIVDMSADKYHLNGYEFEAEGRYRRADQTIEISPSSRLNNVSSVTAHEITHDAFAQVYEGYRPYFEPGSASFGREPDNTPKEVKDFFDHLYANKETLYKDDGVTDYSEEYWHQAARSMIPKHDTEIAWNETLAEISGAKESSSYTGLPIHFSVKKEISPTWSELHDRLFKAYNAVEKKRKEYSPLFQKVKGRAAEEITAAANSKLQRLEVNGQMATVAFLTELGGAFTEPEKAGIVVVRYDDGNMAYLQPTSLSEATMEPKNAADFTLITPATESQSLRGAARILSTSRSETAIHKAADAQLPKFRNSLKYAFVLAKKKLPKHIKSVSDTDKAVDTLIDALSDILPPILRSTLVEGGKAAALMLPQLKTAGGKGSGNFGHKGRPGEVGGSSDEGGGPDTVFHGTTSRHIKSILKTGLLSEKSRDYSKKQIMLKKQGGYIYLANKLENASVVENGAIFHVKVDKKNLEKDPVLPDEAYRVKGRIAPEHIVAVSIKTGTQQVRYVLETVTKGGRSISLPRPWKEGDSKKDSWMVEKPKFTTYPIDEYKKRFLESNDNDIFFVSVEFLPDGDYVIHPPEVESFRAAAKPLTFRFDATRPEAAEWARKQAASMIKGITKVTRERIREAVAFGIEDEWDDSQVFDEIADAIGDDIRADSIARTETMRAAHAGQRELWDQAVDDGLLTGDEQRVWISTEDRKLCPICDDLDGQTVDLDEPFDSDEVGELDGPPAHPNCRCTEGLV